MRVTLLSIDQSRTQSRRKTTTPTHVKGIEICFVNIWPTLVRTILTALQYDMQNLLQAEKIVCICMSCLPILHQKTTSNLRLQYTLKSRISQEFDLFCLVLRVRLRDGQESQNTGVDTHSIQGPRQI